VCIRSVTERPCSVGIHLHSEHLPQGSEDECICTGSGPYVLDRFVRSHATNEDTSTFIFFQKDARTICTLGLLLSVCWNKPAEAMLPLGVPLPVVIVLVDIVILHPRPSCVNRTFLSSTIQTALGHSLSSGMVASLCLALSLVVLIPLTISQ
jgi:hypothetical protein